MKQEELKVIAEGMGYISGLNGYMEPCFYKLIYTPCFYKLGGRHREEIEYNPLTNNDQMVECYKILLDKGFVLAASEQDQSYAIYLLGNFICEGKTISEAVCKAAYKYFKDK